MKCPYCGSEEGYYQEERVHRFLFFTFDGEPDEATEDITEWTSKRRYCRNCEKILPRKMFNDQAGFFLSFFRALMLRVRFNSGRHGFTSVYIAF